MALVLVVDDLDLVRDLCARMLGPAGHEVVGAASGEDAVRMYQEQRPDGVLLDVSMPGQDGLTTLKQIREIDPDARIAMLTSYREDTIVRRAIELGARDYVAKPFQKDRLIAAVGRLVGP